MGRNIEGVRAEEWVTYVPDAFENAEDPDPVTVELRPLSGEQMRAQQRIAFVDAATGKKMRREGKAKRSEEVIRRTQAAQARIFAENVRNVRNYVINGEPVLTGEDMFRRGEQPFIDDIDAALVNLSKVQEGILGKSRSLPASPSAETGASQAGAADAAGGEKPSSPSSLTVSGGLPVTATASNPPSPLSGPQSSSGAPGLS